MRPFQHIFRVKSSFPKPLGARFISGVNKWVKVKEGSPPGVLTSTSQLPSSNLTVPEFLFQNLGKWEKAPFIECSESGQRYTHGEIYIQSRNFASALIQAGFQKNDVICTLLPNIPQYPIVAMGIMMAGGIMSSINPTYPKHEIINQIRDCNAKGLITTSELIPILESARQQCPLLTKKTVVIGDAVQDCHTFFEMVKADANNDLLTQRRPTLDATCMLIYSNGTMGTNKFIEHTHASMTNGLVQVSHPDFCLWNMPSTTVGADGVGQDRGISVLPLCLMSGMVMSAFISMYHGAFLYSIPKFQPHKYVKAILEQKPTAMMTVVPLFNYLLQDDTIPRDAFKHTRGIMVAGQSVGQEMLTNFQNKFGSHIFLQEGYGMREMFLTHAVPKDCHNTKLGSCGVLTPGTSCKIVDVDTGNICGPNQLGEICCTSDAIMKGYYGNEEVSKFTLREDSFVYSGDIGYYNEKGFYYIVDKVKEVLKVNGQQVAPTELEQILRTHPSIADVAVVGVKHNRFGEAPRAYIVKKPDVGCISEDAINSFLLPQISSYKQLFGGIEIVNIIPRDPSGKTLKHELLSSVNKRKQVAN